MSSRNRGFDAPTVIAGGDPLAGSSSALEAERAQWFYWVPMALGAGIAAHFALALEPPLPIGPLALVGV